MNFSKRISVLLLAYLILVSCKKAGADSVTANLAPSNLQVSANVSTDGSGTVAFTATATNAYTFVYEFGNGEIKTVPSGITTYQYTSQGTISYTVTVTATSNTGKSVSKSIPVTVNVEATGPSLFWSEEFNTDGAPDPTKWGYDIGAGGWGNAELQYYTNRSDNVIVSNGMLKITAKKENFSGSNYTSTRLLSKGKFDFKYGKVEVRAKIPAGVGTWPAIWMLGSNISTVNWPNCGEIDIMEHRGSELNKIFGTLHYPGRSGGNADGATKTIANATTEFHIYSLDWTSTYIKIYVDDQLIHSVSNSVNLPFNHNFFLLLNIAMGGTFAGAVDSNVTQATMEVDYIRIYK